MSFKSFTSFISFLTACLFIFSGLIKLNDPVGTEIKLEEYFEVFQTDFAFLKALWQFLAPHSLSLGVFMSVAEVVLGVQLLVRYRVSSALRALLALIVFFTFLTFYSAYFNKVTDCGCFGDAIKLTPWQSFGKDIILLIALLFLWFNKKHLLGLMSNWASFILIISVTICSTYLAYYCINHLPLIDFRNYKVGNSIPKLMQPSAPLKYKYIMEKDGKQVEFEQYPADTSYKYKEMVLLNPEDMPKITDFRIWGKDIPDYTQEVLKGKKMLIIIADVKRSNSSAMGKINQLAQEVSKKGIQPLVLTSASPEVFEAYRKQWQLAIPFFMADKTLLKTMIRSNPGIMFLNNGKVKAQFHYNDTPDISKVEDIFG
ncbi:MAG: DoxX family protein [Microscillaceae bacterium]|nr:DoxX family protein [Microscillaceae bacterium]MDW8460078.1 DoxX family protein [Cytophagales bacterium]